jgi:hypothetical protein
VQTSCTSTLIFWILHHQGQALNTNANFQRINGGGPRVATWSYNPGDRDQQFSFVENGDHHMIVSLSTNQCLNAYLPSPNSLVNLYNCNRNDNAEQWKVVQVRDLGNYNWDVMIQRKRKG